MGTTGRKAAVIMRQVAPKIAEQITAPHKLIMMDDGTIDQCDRQRGGWVGGKEDLDQGVEEAEAQS